MQETNMRVNALYDLAVELEYKTQHPMGCRVLGPKLMVKLRTPGSAMAASR
jgi:hypothetical protein